MREIQSTHIGLSAKLTTAKRKPSAFIKDPVRCRTPADATTEDKCRFLLQVILVGEAARFHESKEKYNSEKGKQKKKEAKLAFGKAKLTSN